jgi:hypothetical protein
MPWFHYIFQSHCYFDYDLLSLFLLLLHCYFHIYMYGHYQILVSRALVWMARQITTWPWSPPSHLPSITALGWMLRMNEDLRVGRLQIDMVWMVLGGGWWRWKKGVHQIDQGIKVIPWNIRKSNVKRWTKEPRIKSEKRVKPKINNSQSQFIFSIHKALEKIKLHNYLEFYLTQRASEVTWQLILGCPDDLHPMTWPTSLAVDWMIPGGAADWEGWDLADWVHRSGPCKHRNQVIICGWQGDLLIT